MIEFEKAKIVTVNGEVFIDFVGRVGVYEMEYLVNKEDRTVGLLKNIGKEFRTKLDRKVTETAKPYALGEI